MRFLRTLVNVAARFVNGAPEQEEGLAEVEVEATRWRGTFARWTAHADGAPIEAVEKKDLFVYARSYDQAFGLFSKVKRMTDTNMRPVVIGENGWALAEVKPDDTNWEPQLVNDFYQPEKRAG